MKKYRKAKNVRQTDREREICICRKKERNAINVRQTDRHTEREREIYIYVYTCRKKERNAKNVRQTDRERETRKTLGRRRDTEREKK